MNRRSVVSTDIVPDLVSIRPNRGGGVGAFIQRDNYDMISFTT